MFSKKKRLIANAEGVPRSYGDVRLCVEIVASKTPKMYLLIRLTSLIVRNGQGLAPAKREQDNDIVYF